MQPELLQYVSESVASSFFSGPVVLQPSVAPSVVPISALPSAPGLIPPAESSNDAGHITALPTRNKRERDWKGFEEEQKRIRLEVFDPMLDAFNTGDFDQMSSLIHSACHHDVKITMPQCISYQGVTPILVLWGLLHETYPDAMTKILEKRISSIVSSTCRPIQRVEYVYKLQGTGITHKPAMESFTHIMDDIGHYKVMSHDEVISVISRHMATIPPHSCDDHTSTFIVETVLTFDNDNKIIEWSYDILACC